MASRWSQSRPQTVVAAAAAMPILLSGLTCYTSTPVFKALSVPSGLLQGHCTKAGTWAKIVVLQGELRYVIETPRITAFTLTTEQDGVIEPGVRHHVEPAPHCEFRVDFYRQA